MPRVHRFFQKKIGKRNLPFVVAVIVLALIVMLLMYLSPAPYSDRGTATPPASSGE